MVHKKIISPCYHYLTTLTNKEDKDGSLSLDYGFLPEKIFTKTFPKPYDVWSNKIDLLPQLALRNDANLIIGDMPILPTDSNSLPEEKLKQAATILSLLAHACWRFGTKKIMTTRNSDVDNSLPESIRIPWEQVCSRLKRSGCFQNMDDLMLNNFTFSNPDFIDSQGSYKIDDVRIENIKILYPAFKNEAERVFYGAIIEIHAVSAPIVKSICQIQHIILTKPTHYVDEILVELNQIIKCVQLATRAFMKISPMKKSKTYCDPIMWAKTIAIFNVPPKSAASGPLSGSAVPFLHILDAFLGRKNFDSDYGQFSKKIKDNYINEKTKGFILAIEKCNIITFINDLHDEDEQAYESLKNAFNKLVDQYAGESGFLDKHVSKVFNYLGVGTMVGRNQSTSLDERYVFHKTWTSVAKNLKISAIERERLGDDEKETPLNSKSTKTLYELNNNTEQKYDLYEVAKHRFDTDGWIVINNSVYDISSFIMNHPGGYEIMRIHLGLDSSADFNIISQHGNSRVNKMLQTYRIGTLDTRLKEIRKCAFYLSAEYLIRIQNALHVQAKHDSDATTKFVYFMQGYSNFVQESIPELIKSIAGETNNEINGLCHNLKEIMVQETRSVLYLNDIYRVEFLLQEAIQDANQLLDKLVETTLAMSINDTKSNIPKGDKIKEFLEVWLTQKIENYTKVNSDLV